MIKDSSIKKFKFIRKHHLMFICLKTKFRYCLKLFLAIVVLLLITEFDAREKMRLFYAILYNKWKPDYQLSYNQHEE